jgi:hypothetical protein
MVCSFDRSPADLDRPGLILLAQSADDDRVKLFVLTPGGRVDDTTETLHQLVHTANALGYDASTVYVGPSRGAGVPPEYRGYANPVDSDAVDSSSSFIIAPTGEAARLLDYRSAQRGLWWLPDTDGAAEIPGDLARTLRDPKARCIHLTPSARHRKELSTGGTAGITLTDHLPTWQVDLGEPLHDQPKGDVIVHHGSNRQKLLGALQSRLPDSINWVPLPEEDPEGMVRTLGQAKVLLDLTGTAGAGRVSRLATVTGCCVVASGFPMDIDDPGRTVPERYRVPDGGVPVAEQLAPLIADILENHPDHRRDNAERRERILDQPRAFIDEAFVALATVEAFQYRVQHLTVP